MAILVRTTATVGPLVLLWTRTADGVTTAVQINDVILPADGADDAEPMIVGPIDAGQPVNLVDTGVDSVTFSWTTSQLTGWFALLAPGLEIRADERRRATIRLTVTDPAPTAPPTAGAIPLTVRFEWTPIDGVPATVSYGGTALSPLPAALSRFISLDASGGTIGVTGNPGTLTLASHLSWLSGSPGDGNSNSGNGNGNGNGTNGKSNGGRPGTGWRELYPASASVVSFTADPTVENGGGLQLVRFSHGGLTAPRYLADDVEFVASATAAAKQRIPILDCPANEQWITWGGVDGAFDLDINSDGLTLPLRTSLTIDPPSQALRVHHDLGVPLHDAGGADVTFDYRGFTCRIDGRGGPPLVLHTANADHRIELGPDAAAELSYAGLGDEPLRFDVTAFSISDAGIEIDASVRDEPITLHGIATGFRFFEGEVRIREGEVLDFSLSGSGPMPPELVGEAVADIAIRFSQQDVGGKRAVPVGAGATLVTQGSLLGIAVPFAYDLSGIGLGFEGEPGGRYDFFFTLTGTATFSPPGNLPADDPLGLLDTATIDLDEAPLAGDLTELGKAMSFRVELAEPVGFSFLGAFSMEIEEVALYGQTEAFDGLPGIELAGQIKFAEGEGDKKRSAETRHRLIVGPPEPGEVTPRIQLKELGVTIEKGEAFKLDAVVNFVDETDKAGVRQKGFTGQGTIEIQGLPSLAVAVGFMTIDRPADDHGPAETVKAWFIAVNVGKLTLRIPYVNIFLREVGLGFGYRYTLTSIAAADEAEGLADLLRALREASRTQGDLATMDAWQVALEPRGADPRWTIALRALFTQLASPSSKPMKLHVDSEKDLANIFLFDVLAAVRSDLTIFMAARIWLNTNYIDYITDDDGSIQGKPLLSGFAIVQPAHKRFLAQASSNPDGHTGSHPPFPDFLAEALKRVQVAATVLIEPNLVHAELGWPNGLRYNMKAGMVDVDVEAGVIYRIAQLDTGGQDLVLGISYKARASLEFRRSVDLVVAGASIVANASASFGARFIAAAQLGTGSDVLDVYGGLTVDLRVSVRINAWIGISIGFIELKKHFSMALELGFSASLEFGLRVDPHQTTIGVQGRGTLLVRAFGRRFEFGVAVSHEGAVVTRARLNTARYMNLGLEAGDGPVDLEDATTETDMSTADTATEAGTGTTDTTTETDTSTADTTTETDGPASPRLDAGRPNGRPVVPDDVDDGDSTEPAPVTTTPPAAANWHALAVAPAADDGDGDGWTHLVLYPGDGPGFLPVPPAAGTDDNDFAVTVGDSAFEQLERWDHTTGDFVEVTSGDAWQAQWTVEQENEDGEMATVETGLGLYLAEAFIDGEDPPQLPGLDDPDDQVADGRVRRPAASDYEAAVRGTLDQFRRSPHFRPDPESWYEQNLRTAFSPQTDVYEDPSVEQARQLRSMAVDQMIGDAREWSDDNDAIDPATSPVFMLGLVFRAKGGDWLDGAESGLTLAQRIGSGAEQETEQETEPDQSMSDPVEVTLFNRAETSFTNTAPDFEQVSQFADAAMVAFDWELTWPLDDDIDHHLAHYEVHRRAMLDATDQVSVTTYKPADAIGHVGDGVIRLIRRRFEFVDNFEGETLDQIAAIPSAGRTYVYTITPVDVTGGRGRPITLVATRLPSSPPMAPTDVDLTVVYELGTDDFALRAADPDLAPLDPAAVTVAWTEQSPPVGRPQTPIVRRELVFRRRATLPIGSYGLDTATNAASSGDLPSSSARVRRDDIVVELTPVENGDDGQRRQATITVDTLRDVGVFPTAGWQPDAWQVFVRTVSDADVPSALVMAKVLLRFLVDPDEATIQPGAPMLVEDRQPAELEWPTPPSFFRPLPVADTLARSGVLHLPHPTADGDRFAEDPADTRLVRVRWNQVQSGDEVTATGLTAGYHVFRLDVDAHTVATFESPRRIADAARLLDEVRLQRPDALALDPADTATPGLWRTFPTPPRPELFPEGRILAWPGWSVDPEPTVEAILHPILQKLVVELRAGNDDIIVGLQQGRPVIESGTEEFMTTFGPGADPDGWALLQFLGLSVTISMRRRSDNSPVDGASIDRRIAAVLPAVVSAVTDKALGEGDGPVLASICQHLRIERLYQPGAASAIEPGDVPPEALLAMVQVSLRPQLVTVDGPVLIGNEFGPGNLLVNLQALVDRATTEPGKIDVTSVPTAFLARFVPSPIAPGRPHLEATAIPRSSAPVRVVPDAQGRVHYDDFVGDGYAHGYRYYVRPYGRYDRLWSGLVQSSTFRSVLTESGAEPADYAIDRPIDVDDGDGSVGPFGADAALDRVAPLAPPVILSSSRVDPPPASDDVPAPPGSTWEIVLSGHREQWLSEQNRTVARRLDYRQMMFTVTRTFRFADAVAAVDWTPATLRLPDRVAGDLPSLPPAIDELDLSETADPQTRADLDVIRRVGESAKQAEIIQLSSLPFYYEHEFTAVAQSSFVVSDIASVRHREFGYRSPEPLGTATAEAVGETFRRTVTVELARLWDSLTDVSQTRWPGEDPTDADSTAPLASALPDPGVAYDVLFSRAGTVQPVAAIVFTPPSEEVGPNGAWTELPISDDFRVARHGRFVTPHGNRLIGIALTVEYVGEPFEPAADQAVPEVPITIGVDEPPATVAGVSVPTMLVGLSPIDPFEPTAADTPAVTESHAALEALDTAASRSAGEVLWTPFDPTRPMAAIPHLVADVDSEGENYTRLHLTADLGDDHRALLVALRNQTDPVNGVDGVDGWEAAVTRLCACPRGTAAGAAPPVAGRPRTGGRPTQRQRAVVAARGLRRHGPGRVAGVARCRDHGLGHCRRTPGRPPGWRNGWVRP